ncbi:hypothetical protein MSAN_00730700 [Mycena sanguinolenta]|uniref:Uncharacterized protein n=1 Tax=Mycena sanguinolenta TaxID=230812 RepID=A0A8H6Z607_9AGAR|nr:hypothetical protein MSAN_00730700 [Mycena sanguinolenta]
MYLFTFKTLFEARGPWLHSATAKLGSTDPPSEEYLAQLLHANYPCLKPGQGLRLISSVLSHSYQLVASLNTVNIHTLGYYLKLVEVPSCGMLNNFIFVTVQQGFPPILVFDALLHAGNPELPAENVPRAPARPLTEKSHYEHFIRWSDWKTVLKEGHNTYLKAKDVADQPRTNLDAMKDSKRKHLERLQFLNDRHTPGSTAAYNVAQAVFLLEAMLEGKCVLTKDDIIDIAYQKVVAREPTTTREEVCGILRNPNTDGMPAALAVAVVSSPLFLLMDNNYAAKRYNPGLSVFDLWRARGNTHRMRTGHPFVAD